MKLNFDERPLSWSAISSFEYNPEQWFRRYVLKEKQEESAEMKFGKEIGKKLETDPTFLPSIKRFSKMEHPFSATLDGIKMVGYADSFCDKTFKFLAEYKTGKREWTQERVDNHGQINMYLLMNWLINKIDPKDVETTLYWMPTQDFGNFDISFVKDIEKNIKSFITKRTMTDILKFSIRIQDTVKKMQEYVDNKALTQ